MMMGMTGLNLDVETFRAMGRVGDTAVDIIWSGECDLAAVNELEGFFDAVHKAAIDASPPRDVRLDLYEVSFMNSSCLSKLVAWLAKVRDADASSRYKVRIRSNPEIPWQKRSLRAVQFFAPELVTVSA
jgi:hypothetical protein